jgi:hypothetical protein
MMVIVPPGRRSAPPDDRRREAIHGAAKEEWIASSFRSLAKRFAFDAGNDEENPEFV